jgi:lipocalin
VTDALLYPYKIFPAKSVGSYKFLAQQNDRRLHVVASPNKENQWIIVSVWVRGEDDSRFWLEEVIGTLVEWVLRKLFPRK